MSTFGDFMVTLFNLLLGVIRRPPMYDAIIVGAGAAGCPLAQTLIEGGLKVLLVERGGERSENSKNILTSGAALFDECAENFSSDGVVLSTGNCLGGATAYNQGIWIEETPGWVMDQFGLTNNNDDKNPYSESDVADAFSWVRERVAPEPVQAEDGSPKSVYFNRMQDAFVNAGLPLLNVDPGQPYVSETSGVWRTHSIFHPETGERRSADTLLDRDNDKLDIKTNTPVAEILFDGDRFLPLLVRFMVGSVFRDRDKPQARCVRFENEKLACVNDDGGRIFLAAGAFHTPELLLKSGIGPDGSAVDNPDVGQYLSDKPLLLLNSWFPKNFDYSKQMTYGNIAAHQVIEDLGSVIFEELSLGENSVSIFDIAAFEGILSPSVYRDSLINSLSSFLIRECADNRDDFFLAVPCALLYDLENQGCLSDVSILAILVADPTSRGSVTLEDDELRVNANHLDTKQDREKIGMAARKGFEVLTSVPEPLEPQTPCQDSSSACLVSSCPDRMATAKGALKVILDILPGMDGDTVPSGPASTVFPNYVEKILRENPDDREVGSKLRFDVASPQHFAGTAAVGRVLDPTFRVMGTEGLYVADASSLPITTRVNTMATAMMVGRLAGLQMIQDRNAR